MSGCSVLSGAVSRPVRIASEVRVGSLLKILAVMMATSLSGSADVAVRRTGVGARHRVGVERIVLDRASVPCHE